MMNRISRRRFVVSTGMGAAAMAARPWRAVGQVSGGTAEKVNVAMIGAGGKGGDNIRGVLETGAANIVALADVDGKTLGRVGNELPKARAYGDFRHLLEKQKDIDAVVVTTPDHMHAYIALMAMDLGKHVYCEKPLTHSIAEARLMRKVAARKRLATQMGNAGHSSESLRTAMNMIRGGAVGKVKEVHCWSDRPVNYWPQGVERPKEEHPVPSELNWEVWLGTAPYRPFHGGTPFEKHPGRGTYHPFCWRGWVDFGTGALGDMGCHILDCPFWALELGAPQKVEAEHSGFNGQTFPEWSIVTYHFSAKGNRPAVKLVWHDGMKKPPKPAEMEADRQLPLNGSIFIGDKGSMILSHGGGPRLIPEARMKDYRKPEQVVPFSIGHHKEWIEACKGGRAAGTNFDYAGPLTETVLLGNIAIAAGKAINWDAETMQVTNLTDTRKWVSREYRKGWEIEGA